MLYLELFACFAVIGFTSFGGLSMIPLINDQMVSHGWLTSAEVSDIIGLAEMTPGPLGLNCATFAGMRAGGIIGMIVANLGVLFPTFTICLVVAILFNRFKNSYLSKKIMIGVRPTVIGLIIGVLYSLIKTNYISNGIVSPSLVLIGALDIFLLQKLKFSIPLVISLSAMFGIVVSYFNF